MAEHQSEELVPASEVLDITIPVILINKATELVVVQKIYQLCEYIFAFVHLQYYYKAAKLQNQIVAHSKLCLKDCISAISKND